VAIVPFFERDNVRFHYRDLGRGLPFVFQHGLGGDLEQPCGLYRPASGMHLVAFDMRAHGQTRPLGDVEKLTIDALADDLIALWDHLGIERGSVGGISLGAAVAASVALRYPERVTGLILSRPAWIDRPLPENVDRYATIARLIRTYGSDGGLKRFRGSPMLRAIKHESPDCASSLESQFENPRAEECVARLERLAGDTLCADQAAFRGLKLPTLILGNRQDPIHPWALAQELQQLIAGSELREVTPKSVSINRHAADVQREIDDFLTRHFLSSSPR
jgi:pimeloyl-ACP methyl ester carboxylesterase